VNRALAACRDAVVSGSLQIRPVRLGAGRPVGLRIAAHVRRAYAMDPVPIGSVAESSSSAGGLLWKKRAKIVVGPTHRRRIWESGCGRYRVVHSRCLYGPRKGRQAIPDVWYAMKLATVSGRTCWEVISQHRGRGPAVRACEKDAKKNRDETHVCDRCGERPATCFAVRTLFSSNTQLCRLCWKHSRRRPRFGLGLAVRQNFGSRRRFRPSPDQLTFAFTHETD
jgi:hypothetical protein